MSNYFDKVYSGFSNLPRWQKVLLGGVVSSFVLLIFARRKRKQREQAREDALNSVSVQLYATKEVDCHTVLGECCLWDDRKQRLCWIDNDGQKFWMYDPQTKSTKVFDTPEKIGSFCFCEHNNDLILAGFRNGPRFYNPETQVMGKRLFEFEPGKKTVINDGRVDRQGRFVVGGMTLFELWDNSKGIWWNFMATLRNVKLFIGSKNLSGIYRINKNLTRDVLVRNIMISNSICFSLNGLSMYYTDSLKGVIYKKRYDEDSKVEDEVTKFVSVSIPDGSVVDSEGGLWNATYSRGKILRYNEKGEVDVVVHVPDKNVTCATFGGKDLNILYITTLTMDRPPPKVGNPNYNENWGALYSVKIPNTIGVLENRFGGDCSLT